MEPVHIKGEDKTQIFEAICGIIDTCPELKELGFVNKRGGYFGNDIHVQINVESPYEDYQGKSRKSWIVSVTGANDFKNRKVLVKPLPDTKYEVYFNLEKLIEMVKETVEIAKGKHDKWAEQDRKRKEEEELKNLPLKNVADYLNSTLPLLRAEYHGGYTAYVQISEVLEPAPLTVAEAAEGKKHSDRTMLLAKIKLKWGGSGGLEVEVQNTDLFSMPELCAALGYAINTCDKPSKEVVKD